MFVELRCVVCGRSFPRNKWEAARNEKVGRKIYCSRTCMGKDQVIHWGDKRATGHLRKGQEPDEYSTFRATMAKVRLSSRRKGRAYDITLHDLKEQWAIQDGKCPYTGWKLRLPRTTSERRTARPDTASLDRIDSTKDYVKGNVEFVSLMAQFAKNAFTKEDVLLFCEAVANEKRTKPKTVA